MRRKVTSFCPPWAAALLFAAGMLALLSLGGCRRTTAAAVGGARVGSEAVQIGTAGSPGTISGTVRRPEGTGTIEGRTVAVLNLQTGERLSAVTNASGGFSLQVKPGQYRVDLQLQEGESILNGPGVATIGRTDGVVRADFTVGAARVLRRHASPTFAPGLGVPIA